MDRLKIPFPRRVTKPKDANDTKDIRRLDEKRKGPYDIREETKEEQEIL